MEEERKVKRFKADGTMTTILELVGDLWKSVNFLTVQSMIILKLTKDACVNVAYNLFQRSSWQFNDQSSAGQILSRNERSVRSVVTLDSVGRSDTPLLVPFIPTPKHVRFLLEDDDTVLEQQTSTSSISDFEVEGSEGESRESFEDAVDSSETEQSNGQEDFFEEKPEEKPGCCLMFCGSCLECTDGIFP